MGKLEKEGLQRPGGGESQWPQTPPHTPTRTILWKKAYQLQKDSPLAQLKGTRQSPESLALHTSLFGLGAETRLSCYQRQWAFNFSPG